MCILLFLNGTPLWANPTGGVVAAGSASITDAGATTTINQSTASAIINWQQFSIASNEATKFFVPSSAAVTLNRVLGGNPSAIYGELSSNGRLILVNPSGIVVGPTGRIDTASFIGSTLAVSDDEFLQGGDLHFLGNGSGAIDNEGTIHASTGDVYLVAGQVTNGGTISAPHGTAGLAAGTDILFQQAGDQHLYVQSTPLTSTRAQGVTNSGTIKAAAAELKAAGGNAYALAINNTGQITATGFKKINGQVYLTADGADIDNSGQIVAHNADGNGGTIVLNGYGTSSTGTVLNSGKLIASGTKSGATGGTVEMLGNRVGVSDFGLVDVSGDAGGGTALLGGDEHGANAAIPDADQTYLGPDATIKADALTLGNGGKVVLWGNKTTQAYGAISVRGGAQGGNGGFVETSAKTLDAQTVPDLSAPKGSGGSWLLDPSNIYISDTVVVSTAPDASAWDPPPFTLTEDGTYDLKQDDLAQALASGSVELDASAITGTIEWSDSSEVFAPALAHATTLTLNGPGNILISGVTINTTGTAGLNLVLNSSLSTAGSIEVLESNIALNGGSFTANGQGQVSQSQYQNNSGFYLESSTLDAQGGSISITGYAGYGNNNGSTDAGDGVFFNNTGQGKVLVTTSGTGNITIKGYSSQDITSSQGFTGVGIQGGGSEATSSTTVSVASGLLDIEGYVMSGTADSSTNNDNVNGVNINGGAQIEATAAGGSVTLVGDVSASTVEVSGSNPGQYSLGVEIDGGNGDGTTVSVVGAINGVGGVLTITGTGGTLDTTYSTASGNNVPGTSGVNISDEASISTGMNATVTMTGTGGTVQTTDGEDTSAYTGDSGGVTMMNSSLTMGTGGTLSITGYGGAVSAGYGAYAADADSEGISLSGGSGTNLITVADGGTITLTGYGGALDNSNAQSVATHSQPDTEGVSISSHVSLEASGSTTISITGTGGNIATGESGNLDGNAIGVNIGSGDGSGLGNVLVSSGTGSITIIGYGGQSPNLAIGAEVHGFNGKSATVETTGGDISITGTGGPDYAGDGQVSGNLVPSHGVAVIDDATLQTTGTGTITLTGTGNVPAAGAVVEELNDTVLDSEAVSPTITAGGALTIQALASTGELVNNAIITAASATIGAETTPGDASTISSGHLDIINSSVTLTGGNFIAYGAGSDSSNFEYSVSYTNVNPDGIDVTDSTIKGAGGDVTLVGEGGYLSYINEDESTTFLAGVPVRISNDANGTTLIDTTGSGNITITGINDTDVTSANGLVGVFINGTTTDTFSTELSVTNGLLSITGKVLSGTADGTDEECADLGGISILNSALTATGTGSITLNGDVSAATSTVSGSNFSFVSGIEIGTSSQVSAQSGTITIDGTGGSIDASNYNGESRVFSEGVQIDNDADVSTANNGTIIVDGMQASSATAVDADMLGTLIDLGAQVTVGSGGEISLTGTTPNTTVTSSTTGNTNVGLEIDSYNSDNATTVTVGTNGTLVLAGTSGTIDASAASDGQAGSAGIDIDAGSQVTAGVGTGVTITGTGGPATTSTGNTGNTAGFVLDSATLTLSGGNTTTITGTGGTADDGTNVATNNDSSADSAGVDLSAGSLISVGTGTNLTVYGYGSGLTTTHGTVDPAGSNFPDTEGIDVKGDIEATGSGSISLFGYGGDVTSMTSTIGTSFGVNIGDDESSTTVSAQSGLIDIVGQGGISPNLGIGVAIHGFNGNLTTIQTTSGGITISGQGATGNSGAGSFTGFYEPNYGVLLLNRVLVETTTGGTISITGEDLSGEPGGYGVATQEKTSTALDTDPAAPQVSSSGTLMFNALSGTGIALEYLTASGTDILLGTETTPGNPSTISSGPVEIADSSLTAGAAGVTVFGKGDSDSADGIDVFDSTIYWSGGSVGLVGQSMQGAPGTYGIQAQGDTFIANTSAGPVTLTGDSLALGLSAATLVLNDGTGALTQTGALDLGTLTIDSAGSVTLTNTGNNISTLGTIDATGPVSIYTDPGLLLLTNIVEGSGAMLLESIGGDLTLGSNASVIDNGAGNITLVTDKDFINDSSAGSNAVQATNGSYHIYSNNPDSANLGALPVSFTQYSDSYPAGNGTSGNGVFYEVAYTGGGGGGTGDNNPTSNPGQGTGGDLPPVVGAPVQTPPTYNGSGQQPGGNLPPTFSTTGTGNFSQSDSQSGGLAFSSGSGGQVGAGDAAQLNNGQMNNVSNPHASGALNAALSPAVQQTLSNALSGDFADATGPGESGPATGSGPGGNTQIIGDGGVVEIGNGTVQQIPLSSAPPQLQNALGNGVEQGMQGSGH